LTISIIILILLHGLDISDIPGSHRIKWLDRSVIDFAGFGLGKTGLVNCLAAQFVVENSWRAGIDQKRTTNLVTLGIFQ